MSITSLPVEVMSIICSHLQLLERKMLRLSCRTLCRMSSEDFFDRYFESIYFIVTSDSLSRLEDLAQSDDIRKRVQELWMIPTVFEGLHNLDESNMRELRVSAKSCHPIDGDELKARCKTYKAMVADSSNLLNSDAFSARLSKCMEKFNNLDGAGLAHYTTNFLLDPRQHKVRFLGWRHLVEQIDFRFTSGSLRQLCDTSGTMRRINSLAFSGLLQALRGSGRKVRTLHTCDHNYCADVGSEIMLPRLQYDSLLPALERLVDLHLCIDFEENTWVNLITKVSSGLKRLTLSQSLGHPSVSQPYWFADICERAEFIQLRELHLHQVQVTSDSLKLMLSKAKETLGILKLTRVRLIDDVLESPGENVDSPDRSEAWYTHPPNLFYCLPCIPPLSPFSPVYSTPATSNTPALSRPIAPTSFPNAPPIPMASTQRAAQPEIQLPPVQATPPPPSNPYVQSTSFAPRNPYTNPVSSTPYSNVPSTAIPERQEDFLWKRTWDFFSNELSLQKFSMAEIASGAFRVHIEGIEGKIAWKRAAVFDADRAGPSFREWIDQLTPLRYLGAPDSESLEKNRDHGKIFLVLWSFLILF